MQPLNPETLATLRDFMQPAELRDFLKRVKQELRSAWPPMQRHLHAHDWAQVEREAHRLKSVVGSVGCDGLYQALHQLENDLRATPPSPPQPGQVMQLDAWAADAEQALSQAIGSGSALRGFNLRE